MFGSVNLRLIELKSNTRTYKTVPHNDTYSYSICYYSTTVRITQINAKHSSIYLNWYGSIINITKLVILMFCPSFTRKLSLTRTITSNHYIYAQHTIVHRRAALNRKRSLINFIPSYLSVHPLLLNERSEQWPHNCNERFMSIH